MKKDLFNETKIPVGFLNEFIQYVGVENFVDLISFKNKEKSILG